MQKAIEKEKQARVDGKIEKIDVRDMPRTKHRKGNVSERLGVLEEEFDQHPQGGTSRLESDSDHNEQDDTKLELSRRKHLRHLSQAKDNQV